ncbi:MAG: hypothetical protein ABSC37_22170 [Xanthobacteraceae bacterium]
MSKPNREAAKIGEVDVELFAQNLARLIEESGKAFSAYLKPREEGKLDDGISDQVTDAIKSVGRVAGYWLADPMRVVEMQASLGRAYLDLWASAVKRMTGEPVEPVATPDSKDRRFIDPEWSSNQFFDFLKRAYLLTTHWADYLVKHAEGLDPLEQQKAEFYVRQIVNAISPSNFVLTNPELLRATLSSNAENLVRGMHMLSEDVKAGQGHLKIRQTDFSQFELGRNLATTQGKVIFQNDLIQLIQYEPRTPTVLKRPLLIVPPWINKFYILDLTPENSFIKWCVGHELTVFVISWVNPDVELAMKTFEDYMREGPLAAIEAVEKLTGEKQINVIGYCVGGTLLAVTIVLDASWIRP